VLREIALEPKKIDDYVLAISQAGGTVTDFDSNSKALVWTDYSRPDLLEALLDGNHSLTWVQLPFAGVDAFSRIIIKHPGVVFTSAKRSYSEPVAEHALMLCMALGRILPERIRATSWGRKHAESLFDEDLLVVGGGGIAQKLVEILVPFRTRVTVVRKRPSEEFANSEFSKVVSLNSLDSEIPKAKFVIAACALTEETRFLFDERLFSLMRNDSYLVNVARGEVVNQDALIKALQSGQIAGAATDVTYPEPLPDGHEMWKLDNLIITPHSADTPQIVKRLFSIRLRDNVAAYLGNQPFVGVVDSKLGY
jgi:phosphoglycerate dehydrogenase-like enzyme